MAGTRCYKDTSPPVTNTKYQNNFPHPKSSLLRSRGSSTLPRSCHRWGFTYAQYSDSEPVFADDCRGLCNLLGIIISDAGSKQWYAGEFWMCGRIWCEESPELCPLPNFDTWQPPNIALEDDSWSMRRPSCRRCWPIRWRTWRQSSEWLPKFKLVKHSINRYVYIYNAGARQNEPPSMPHNWVPYHPMICHYIFRIIWWPQIVVMMLIFDTRQYTVNFWPFFQGRCANFGIESRHKEDETHWLVGESQSFLCLIMRGYNLLAKQVSRSRLWLGLWPTYKKAFHQVPVW